MPIWVIKENRCAAVFLRRVALSGWRSTRSRGGGGEAENTRGQVQGRVFKAPNRVCGGEGCRMQDEREIGVDKVEREAWYIEGIDKEEVTVRWCSEDEGRASGEGEVREEADRVCDGSQPGDRRR